MKQNPSRLKFKKYHKVSKSVLFLAEQKVFYPARGSYGVQLQKNSRLTLKHIEACRKCIRRNFKKTGMVFVRSFTNHSITKKSIGSRMGSGKGNHAVWVHLARAGSIVCELATNNDNIYKAFSTLKGAGSKIPVKCKAVTLKY